MSTSSRTFTRTIALLTFILAASLTWSGCKNEAEVVDEEEPTTGEIEVEGDETEFEAEKELPDKEDRPTGEKTIETEHGWVEVEMEEDEVEIEGETEYSKGKVSAPTDADAGAAIAQPDLNKVITVTKVVPAPVDFVGATVFGKVNVKKVISDRGFWVKSGDHKIFAVVREDEPQKNMIDINKGQKLKFVGVLVDGNDWKVLEGKLEPETEKTLKEQPYFLSVYWDHIEFIGPTPNNQE